MTFPQLSDDPGEVFARFEVPYQPAMVFVAPDGSVDQLLGAVDGDTIDDKLSDLVS